MTYKVTEKPNSDFTYSVVNSQSGKEICKTNSVTDAIV